LSWRRNEKNADERNKKVHQTSSDDITYAIVSEVDKNAPVLNDEEKELINNHEIIQAIKKYRNRTP